MTININTATPANLAEIAKLFDGYRQFYGKDSDTALAKSFIRERLQQNESVIFYAQHEDDSYLGVTQLYPTFSSVSASKRWILNDLYVIPDYHNQGVGHLLLNKAKQFATADNACGLQLSTAVDNIGAQKLYESLG